MFSINRIDLEKDYVIQKQFLVFEMVISVLGPKIFMCKLQILTTNFTNVDSFFYSTLFQTWSVLDGQNRIIQPLPSYIQKLLFTESQILTLGGLYRQESFKGIKHHANILVGSSLYDVFLKIGMPKQSAKYLNCICLSTFCPSFLKELLLLPMLH